MAGGLSAFLCLVPLHAQGTLADYQRAHELRVKARDLVVNTPGAVTWIGDSDHFWYPKAVKGGTEFVLVDADAGSKKPAFDQEKLAAAISSATGTKYTALKLPFAPMQERGGAARPAQGAVPTTAPLTFLDSEHSIQFGTGGSLYKCSLADYTCAKAGPIPRGGREGRGAAPEDESLLNPDADLEGPGGDPVDGLEYQPPAPQDGDESRFSGRPRGCAPSPSQQAQYRCPCRPARSRFPTPWSASTRAGPNLRLLRRQVGGVHPELQRLPQAERRSGGIPHQLRRLRGKLLFAAHDRLVPRLQKAGRLPYARPGYDRLVSYIESSPADQIQPKSSTIHYAKPGDTLDIAFPVLFDVATKQAIEIDHVLFPNPYSISTPVWWKDGRGFTFEYNQRGHQAYTVIEVDAQTGKTRPLIAEQTKTFFYYNDLGPGLSAGRKYRHDVNDGKEIIWASERDGWEHLYLYDGLTGKVKNQITKGNWLVRNVEYVDDQKRQIFFDVGGIVPGQDPYFTQLYRINFDGTGLTKLTDADGTHTVTFSHDRKFYVDTWQRVDLAPIAQLRRSSDQTVVMWISTRAILRLCWQPASKSPEVFVAKGRDGKDRHLGRPSLGR